MAKVVIMEPPHTVSGKDHISFFPSRWSATSCMEDYYPFMLGYLSSLLKRDTYHEVKFIGSHNSCSDGTVKELTTADYLKLIDKEYPDWLITECDFLTALQVTAIARYAKENFGTRIVLTGQYPTAMPVEALKVADYVCIGEYEFVVLDLLKGKNPKGILGLYPNERRPLLDINKLPWPEDQDIRRFDYRTDLSSKYKEAQVYASRGCPFSCTFCVCRHVYYGKPNWRPRDISNIVSEIEYLKTKYPKMEGVFFNEEVHNLDKKFILKLTNEIIEVGLDDLYYDAMCGYWTMDYEMLKAMYDAGYYMVRMGIETASASVARGINKHINIGKLIKVLKIARDIGLETYGTFMFGAPNSTKREDIKTLRLLEYLLDKEYLTVAQHSICTPLPGTPFFRWAEENGYLITKDLRKYDGMRYAVVSYPDYTNNEIEAMLRYAGLIQSIHKRSFIERMKVFPEFVQKVGIKSAVQGTINYLKIILKLY